MDFATIVASYFSAQNLIHFLRLVLIIGIGFCFIRILMKIIQKTHIHITDHVRFLLSRGIKYVGIFILTIMVLSEFGFHIGTILGVAGIAGAAVGFASQTSLSNIISGLFLLTERSFGLGDQITVSGITGTVVHIGLLSIRLQQSDGTCVRIPNEQLIKDSLVNMSYFEKRRFEVRIVVHYEENIDRVISLVHEIASLNKYNASGVEPVIYVETFKETGIQIFVGIWSDKTSYTQLKRTILFEIIRRFKQEGISLQAQPYVVAVMKESR